MRCNSFVILYGPNGVGKQKIIEALATEANINLIKFNIE